MRAGSDGRVQSLRAPDVSASDDRPGLGISRPRPQALLAHRVRRPSVAGHKPPTTPQPPPHRARRPSAAGHRPPTPHGRFSWEASGGRRGRKGARARLCRGGCGSTEVGGRKGRQFALIALVWSWACGVIVALTWIHDGSAELVAVHPSQRVLPARDGRWSRSWRGAWRSEAACARPQPVVGRRSRDGAWSWAADVQPRTAVGRRSRIGSRSWAAYAQPQTAVGRRSSAGSRSWAAYVRPRTGWRR